MDKSNDGRDRTTSSQRSSMSDMSSSSREWSEVRQPIDGAKRLQPLTIPRNDAENPFLSDPSPLGLPQLRHSSEPDTTTSAHLCQLNLAASWDAAVAGRGSPVASPGLASLLRSHSEARQSPLRNCYSSTGHNKSEGHLPVVTPNTPTPPSPSASQVSTPPLSARILNSPFLSEGSLPACPSARLSLDSSRKGTTETAHTALCNRLEAKLARARGEPLTPYLM